MEDFERNIASVLEALKLSPDNIPLKKNVGELLLQAGRTDEAIQHLKEVLARTEDYDCMVSLGRAYYESEEFGEAANILEQALRKKPTAEVYMLLSKMHFRSEEHTSELQSHLNLVCRLLLEKKKTITVRPPNNPSPHSTSTRSQTAQI